MGKRRIALFVLVIAVLGGFASLVFVTSGPVEPVYRGKPLSYWLDGYDPGNYKVAHPSDGNPPDYQQANEAVRMVGTNVLPFLVRMLWERDSVLKTHFYTLAQRQHIIRIEYWWAVNQSMKAERAFAALGPQNNNLAPELLKIYEAQPCVISRQIVPEIMSHVSPHAKETVPFLLKVLATGDDECARANAAIALRDIHPNAELAVPSLTKALSDPDRRVQQCAAAALAIYGSDARPATASLLKLLAAEKGSNAFAVVSTGYGPSVISPGYACTSLPRGNSNRLFGRVDLLKPVLDALGAIDPELGAKAAAQ